MAAAGALALAMRRMSWGIGLMPEQAWEDPNIPRAPYGSNPATASIGFVDGKAAGSTTPLIWAEGQYVRLVRDLQTGTLVDQPSITRGRYLSGGGTSTLPVAITAPAPGAPVGGTTVVSGTTSPGAAVSVSSTLAGASTDAMTVRAASAPDGHFSVTVPTPAGSDLITVAASAGPRASGWAQEVVTSA